MYKYTLKLEKPAYVTVGFKSEVKNFSVLNRDGKIFYIREFEPEARTFDQFNVNEAGIYTIISGQPVAGVKLTGVRYHKPIPMPKKHWNFDGPVKMIWKNINNSPACMIPKKREVYLNSMIKSYPIGVCNFVIAHELGHRYWPDEWCCDLYAINKVLRSGGNLYTCYYALEKFLNRSPSKMERIKKFIENIRKIDYGRQ
jgi:hypothetical protein